MRKWKLRQVRTDTQARLKTSEHVTLQPGGDSVLRCHPGNPRPEGPRGGESVPGRGSPDGGASAALTSLVLAEGDDVWVVVVDEAWERAGLATAHADLAVPPLACLWVLPEGHQTPAKEDGLRGPAWQGAWGRGTHLPAVVHSHEIADQQEGVGQHAHRDLQETRGSVTPPTAALDEALWGLREPVVRSSRHGSAC